MSLTAIFIRRPVMTILLMIGIVVFGVVSYRRLPVNNLPITDNPTISVNASLPGASPETMAATVATPLEKAFAAIPGIDEVDVAEQPRVEQHQRRLLGGPRSRVGCPGHQRGHLEDAPASAAADPPAVLPQDERGGVADPQHRADVGGAAAHAARRVCGDDHRAAPLDGRRRRTGQRLRVDEVRGAGAARPRETRGTRDRRLAGGKPDRPQQRDAPHGRAVREGEDAHGDGDGADVERHRVPETDRRLQERCGGTPRRPRQRARSTTSRTTRTRRGTCAGTGRRNGRST